MGFDLTTATPVTESKNGFDLSTATPVDNVVTQPENKGGIVVPPTSPLNWKSPLNVVESAYRGAGNLTGQTNKVLVNNILGVADKLISPMSKETMAQFGEWLSNTDIGKAQIKTFNDVKKLWESFKESYPGSAENIEAGANIAAIAPVVKAFTPGKMVLGSGIDKGLNPIYDELIDKTIMNNYKKGINPASGKFKDANITERYYDNVKTAVRDIVDNTDMPISQAEKPVEAFSVASSKTKSKLWDAATEISEGAPVRITYEPTIKAMEKMAANENLIRARPEVVDYLNKKIDDWRSVPLEDTPQRAEDLLSMINSDARNFWNDPQSYNKAATAEYIAQNLRKELYDKMETLGGKNYADFRKRYGAQLTIESDVSKRAAQLSGRKDFGFWDLSNIATAIEMADALVNPISLGKVALIQGTKWYMKSANNPDNIIRKMFSDVERLESLKYRPLNTFSERTTQPLISPPSTPVRNYPKLGIPKVNYPTEDQILKSSDLQELIRRRQSPPMQNTGSRQSIPPNVPVPMTQEQITNAKQIEELIRLENERNKMISY